MELTLRDDRKQIGQIFITSTEEQATYMTITRPQNVIISSLETLIKLK